MKSAFDISLILSLIGCITGLSSLLINFHKFMNERSRLRITFEASRCIYFSKIPYYESSKTNYHALIYIRFLNKSSYPDAIYNVQGELDGIPIVFNACDLEQITLKHSVQDAFNYSFRVFDMTPAFSLPIKLSPFDVWQGYLFAQFFPDSPDRELSINLTISTSRKKAYKRKCCISKWDSH